MKFTFILLLALVAGITTVTPAFADNSEITIGAVEKSGFSQDCVADGCYTPSSSTVNLGGKVIFTNTDTAGIHTFTAGTVDGFAPTPTGEFDSGVLAAGESDEWVADVEGEILFYCSLHTWMTGVVIVEAAEEMMEETVMEKEEMMKMETMMVGDVDVTMSPPIEGSEDATVSIIEFGDYQCPKCDQWFQNEKPTITSDYIDTGKANLYFVDFSFLGDDSTSAAEATYCADEQGMYWEYHANLYNNQGDINGGWATTDNLKQFAADLGLDTMKFNSCLDSGKYSDRVSHNTSVGASNDVEGTPVFFIVASDGTTERIDGPQSSAIFAEVIDSLLGEPMKEAMAEEEMMKDDTMTEEKEGGGCLIATAAYGTELSPQVQFLREIRDNTVMSTSTGASFMTGFNQLYYSFSPTIADMERENPMFQEVVRAFITPMISTLSIMTLAEDGNESQVLGLGISVIALNLGMYIAAPAIVGITLSKRLQSKN